MESQVEDVMAYDSVSGRAWIEFCLRITEQYEQKKPGCQRVEPGFSKI